MVECCLWFLNIGGPFDAVYLATLEPDELASLSEWAAMRSAELPTLAGMLSAHLPIRVPPASILQLAAECGRVDWDTLAGSALGGFAALSLVIKQAAEQAGAGLQLDSDTVSLAAEDGEP